MKQDEPRGARANTNSSHANIRAIRDTSNLAILLAKRSFPLQAYQNSCQLNPYITKDEIMSKIILINIHNLWKHNVYKTHFLP